MCASLPEVAAAEVDDEALDASDDDDDDDDDDRFDDRFHYRPTSRKAGSRVAPDDSSVAFSPLI